MVLKQNILEKIHTLLVLEKYKILSIDTRMMSKKTQVSNTAADNTYR